MSIWKRVERIEKDVLLLKRRAEKRAFARASRLRVDSARMEAQLAQHVSKYS